MPLSRQIAIRYFFSKNKKSFISIIANISMLGVGIGTMALVIVMAVFNGLEDLNRIIFKSFDADLKVLAIKGKNFDLPSGKLLEIKGIGGISAVSEIVEDVAVLRYQNAQAIAKIKGVSDNYLSNFLPDSAVFEGKATLRDSELLYAVLGYGLAYNLNVGAGDGFSPIEVWSPRNVKNLNALNMTDAFNRRLIVPGGIFSIEQQYDQNYVFVPLSFAQDLFETGSKRTAIEIKIKDKEQLATIQNQVKALVGKHLKVLNADEQHAPLLRAIQIEKLFAFIALSFIVAVASLNIFFSLTMLAIEKKLDVKILYAMGGTKALVKQIFLYEGGIVALLGAGVGLCLGIGFCLVQAHFGIIPMGGEGSLFPYLPVRLQTTDLLAIVLVIVSITLITSYFPARKAAKG